MNSDIESRLRELLSHCMFMTLDEASDYLTQHIKQDYNTITEEILFERHGDYREVLVKVAIAGDTYEVTVRQI